MKNSSGNSNGTIKLHTQVLSWDQFKKAKKLVKIIFQFDVDAKADGHKTFSLVAYPVYKGKKGIKTGSRIPLSVSKDHEFEELPLPLTLGNLELNRKQLKNLKRSDSGNMIFKAFLYDKNEHAAYIVTDDAGIITEEANPCPPAKPADF